MPILDESHDFMHPVEGDQAWSESYYFNCYDPGTSPALSWDDELEARTACPTHRQRLTSDTRFVRGALSQDGQLMVAYTGTLRRFDKPAA